MSAVVDKFTEFGPVVCLKEGPLGLPRIALWPEFTYTGPSTLKACSQFSQAYGKRLADIRLQDTLINTAMDELWINTAKYDNNGHDERQILVADWRNQNHLYVTVANPEGPDCDPPSFYKRKDDCLLEENLLKPNGRGLLILDAIAESITYDREKRLWLVGFNLW